jgi:hypothetical protein
MTLSTKFDPFLKSRHLFQLSGKSTEKYSKINCLGKMRHKHKQNQV